MKTITKDRLSVYLFDNDKIVEINENNTLVGLPTELIISDCNTSNSLCYENIVPPEDWRGCKYFFDGNNWSLNPKWIDPSENSNL